jgi:hypothetical protein
MFSIRPYARVGRVGAIVSEERYVDTQGATWDIVTYETPQVSTNKSIQATSDAFKGQVVGGDTIKQVKAGIDKIAGNKNRDPFSLTDNNKFYQKYATGVSYWYTISDNNKVLWYVFEIIDSLDGALGYYATTVDPKKGRGPVVGPDSTLVGLSSDINYYNNRPIIASEGFADSSDPSAGAVFAFNAPATSSPQDSPQTSSSSPVVPIVVIVTALFVGVVYWVGKST